MYKTIYDLIADIPAGVLIGNEHDIDIDATAPIRNIPLRELLGATPRLDSTYKHWADFVLQELDRYVESTGHEFVTWSGEGTEAKVQGWIPLSLELTKYVQITDVDVFIYEHLPRGMQYEWRSYLQQSGYSNSTNYDIVLQLYQKFITFSTGTMENTLPYLGLFYWLDERNIQFTLQEYPHPIILVDFRAMKEAGLLFSQWEHHIASQLALEATLGEKLNESNNPTWAGTLEDWRWQVSENRNRNRNNENVIDENIKDETSTEVAVTEYTSNNNWGWR
jgi:hypothetical protein